MYNVQPEVLEISKALGEDTRFAIFRAIAASKDALTVKDLVARFGMHHSAIRIHLNKLEEAGLIVSRKRHTPGAVGRPQLAFLANPRALAITLPTRNYRFLSDLAIRLILENGLSPDSAEEFGLEWGREQARASGYGFDGPLPFDEGTDLLLEELNGLGGAFVKSASNGKTCVFEQSNCPFLEVAQKYRPHVCSLLTGVARGMLSQMVGAEVQWEHRASMVEGDPFCEAEVSLVGVTGRV